jgi:choline dehydrogenase-like flavoprotein
MPLQVEDTTFSRDFIGRYLCNTWEEALNSTNTPLDPSQFRPDARAFDVIVIGGGSFGPIFAQHLLAKDTAHQHRILVLEAGKLALNEHIQNLPPPIPEPTVWGLPWKADPKLAYRGLAYCLGGRSVFFGGWSPRLLDAEMTSWPVGVVNELKATYFNEASQQIGTSITNDFIGGAMHQALRQQLFAGITANKVTDVVPLNQLPLFLDNVSNQDIYKLEAPLAVQSNPTRSGFFPFNKFSTVPLLTRSARQAQAESRGDDVKKRLMIVPDTHVTRLVTTQNQGVTSVTEILTNRGSLPVAAGAIVLIALGTIESARLAKISFPTVPSASRIGQNLIAHLRSNLTLRIPRASLPQVLPNELQSSALFMKGRHGANGGFFHLQITAAGLNEPNNDSEAELFKSIPDYDTLAKFQGVTDDKIVITLRGIGEMEPHNPLSAVTLDGAVDEYGLPRALVNIVPSAQDLVLWDAMDKASDEVAKIFANGQPFEVLAPNKFWIAVNAGTDLATLIPYTYQDNANSPGRRDRLGTTHHEAGTLAMGTNPNTSVTNPDGRFHDVANVYALGPSIFPTVGSPNPMLTGTALARRLADKIALYTPVPPQPGFTRLFDGKDTSKWKMSTIKDQPIGKDDPGRFIVVNGTLESIPGNEIGLLWYTVPMPINYILRLEWLRFREDDNSGIFLRFPNPDSKNYNNTAYVGVNFGFEVQIDQSGSPDGASIHRTGAIYNFQSASSLPALPVGKWHQYEIQVVGQTYTITLNGQQVNQFTFLGDVAFPDRARTDLSTFIGLQSHPGASHVAFRNIEYKAI